MTEVGAMPESLQSHADVIWYLMILLGIGFIGILSWTSKGKLSDLKEGLRELKTSITRVHERIDDANKDIAAVDGKVNKLEGRADTMEKLFNGKRAGT